MSITKLMKRALLAAISVPGLALAGEPAPQAQSLAAVEAVLEYCTRVVPAAADRFREQAKLVTEGASEETLAKVRTTEEYRNSHDAMLESLAKVSDREAKNACDHGQ